MRLALAGDTMLGRKVAEPVGEADTAGADAVELVVLGVILVVRSRSD
jgi:hypothetical protein